MQKSENPIKFEDFYFRPLTRPSQIKIRSYLL